MTGPSSDRGASLQQTVASGPSSERTAAETLPGDRALLDALDLPEYLKPLQDVYWEKRREFLRLEDAVLTMFVACLDLDAARESGEVAA